MYIFQWQAVAQFDEALRIDSRWCHWNFSLTYSFRPHYGSSVDPDSKINEYEIYFLRVKGGRCIWQTTLPPSCTDCIEIWEPLIPGTLRASPGLQWDCFLQIPLPRISKKRTNLKIKKYSYTSLLLICEIKVSS